MSDLCPNCSLPVQLVEKETYAQRQSLLDELRTIKQREAGIRREAEINGR